MVSSRLVPLYCLKPARRSAPPTLPTDKDHHRAGPESRASTRPRPISLLRPALGDHPVAPRRSRASLPTGFAKKNSGAAASRARMKRKPAQAGALSDANSMHWRFFGSPRVRVRRANLRNAEHFQMSDSMHSRFSDRQGRPNLSEADSMHARPSPCRGCGHWSATSPWPRQRPAPPVHRAKRKSRAALGRPRANG